MYEPLRPQVPLLIGTWSPALARYAGGVAHEVQAGGSSNPAVVARLVEMASTDDGSPRVCLNAVTVVDEDRDRAVAVAREAAALYFEVIARFDPTVTVEEERLAAIRAELRRSDYRAAGALIPTDVLRKFAFAGTAEDVPDQAAEIIDGGAYRVEFDTPFGVKTGTGLGLLCEQVVPRVRAVLS
jgi:5,10-methylenetetrahydromethanopterin reductase